jgi:uncharacterized DUF497 family protein
MAELFITEKIRQKLRDKHGVEVFEVHEAFSRRTRGRFLLETRPEHATNPPSFWFISKTNTGRLLKVIFIPYVEQDLVVIKSAYPPNAEELEQWQKS